MAAVHSAFAGMGSMEQRCFLRAGIEAALTAAGVPLPEGHDGIDCVRLQTAGPKTNCKGTTATMLSLVGLCGGNGETMAWAGGKHGVFGQKPPVPTLEAFQCCSRCKKFWKTVGGKNHGLRLLRAAEKELKEKLDELGPDGYKTWATQLIAEEVRDLYVRSWINPLVPPPKTKKRATATTLEERPANRQAVPAVAVTVSAPAPASTAVPEPDIPPSLAEKLQREKETAQAAKRQAEEQAAAAQAAKRQAEEQAAAAQAKVDELQKKQQASDIMAAMNADDAKAQATRHAKEREAARRTAEAEKQRAEQAAAEKAQHDTYMAMVREHEHALGGIPKQLRTKEICETAVRSHNFALHYVPEALMKELCETAVRLNYRALNYVPEALMTKELCETAVRLNYRALDHVPKALMTKELCEMAVRSNAHALSYWKDKQLTKELCEVAVRSNVGALSHLAFRSYFPRWEPVAKALLTKELCELAVRTHGSALEYTRDWQIVPAALRKHCTDILAAADTDDC